MARARVWLRQLLARQEGQGLVEYGLIISLVAIVALTAVGAFGSVVEQLFQAFCQAVPGSQCS